MHTRTKITIAASLAVLLAGFGAAGISYADSAGWGHHGERHFARFDDDGWMHGHHGRHGGAQRMIRMFESYDVNDDGKLTQVEIDETRAARLAKFDGDGNGALDLKEYEALWLDAMRERMVDRFQDLDDDGDGVVTKDEFVRPFARIVRYMDRNEDGAISRDDMPRHRHGGDRDDD